MNIRRSIHSAWLPLVATQAAGLLWNGASALADSGVPITITNDGTSDIVVTVYDLNASPRRVVVPGERINGFSSIPISVTPGQDGTGHVAWTATAVDANSHLCGHENRQGLQSAESVHVHADMTCTSS
jgi:hypothetical protein